jgi:hypothetical protein
VRYERLRVAAQRVVDEAEAVGNAEHPLCGVKPWHIKVLRRELAGEVQHSAFATMSAS